MPKNESTPSPTPGVENLVSRLVSFYFLFVVASLAYFSLLLFFFCLLLFTFFILNSDASS